MSHALLREAGVAGDQIAALVALLNSSHDRGFEYPWIGLEEAIRRRGAEGFSLVGYGSLLCPKSAARTIADTPAVGHPPVVAIGARRVFNYLIPPAVLASYGVPAEQHDRAALNVDWTHSFNNVLNGRLAKIAITDIPALRDREPDYDLRPVACIPWRTQARPFIAYVLSCEPNTASAKARLSNSLLPYLPYFHLCRNGAELVSSEFLSLFLKTTFLADRCTSMDQWEAQHPRRLIAPLRRRNNDVPPTLL